VFLASFFAALVCTNIGIVLLTHAALRGADQTSFLIYGGTCLSIVPWLVVVGAKAL
jgi:hypothetical protein